MEFSIPFIVVFALALVCLLILSFYYLYYFTSLKKQLEVTQQNDQPVSIIIAARNEIDNLKANLPLVLEQKYSTFEVVLVNDGSFDDTKDYLKELAEKNSKLKIVTLDLDERFHRGKKFALTMGIKAASYERLLFTDADCKPASEFWVQKMMNVAASHEIVLGVSPLNVPKTLLGSIISYETFHTALQYTTYALRGKTYMGVGRNLSYTKSLFFKNKGFASHQHIMSGDDDLFVQEASTGKNVGICINKQAFTLSDSETTWNKWFKQKKRHLSTGKNYIPSLKRILGLYSLAHLFFYMFSLMLLLVDINLWYVPVALFLLKWIIQWAAMYRATFILHANKIRYALPFYDIIYTLFLVVFGVVKPFTRINKWN